MNIIKIKELNIDEKQLLYIIDKNTHRNKEINKDWIHYVYALHASQRTDVKYKIFCREVLCRNHALDKLSDRANKGIYGNNKKRDDIIIQEQFHIVFSFHILLY